MDGYALRAAQGGCSTATGRARPRNERPTRHGMARTVLRVPSSHGKRVPKPQGIKPPRISKQGDAGPAPCSGGFSVDFAGGGRSPREGLGTLLTCAPSPPPCQADLASPVCPAKPNSWLVRVDLARVARAKLTAWHWKGNWNVL